MKPATMGKKSFKHSNSCIILHSKAKHHQQLMECNLPLETEKAVDCPLETGAPVGRIIFPLKAWCESKT